jgi:hypothetical protein
MVEEQRRRIEEQREQVYEREDQSRQAAEERRQTAEERRQGKLDKQREKIEEQRRRARSSASPQLISPDSFHTATEFPGRFPGRPLLGSWVNRGNPLPSLSEA